jgi:hypothetical protein
MKAPIAIAPVLAGLMAFLQCILCVSAARADGPPPTDVVDLTPGASSPPTTPTSEGASAPTEPVEFLGGPHPSKIAAFIFGGAAIVGVGVGIGFGVAALDEKNTFNAHQTASNASLANQDSVISDVGFGAAVIAGVTSIVLFLKHEEPSLDRPRAVAPKPASAVRFSVTPTFSAHTGGAGAVLRF